MMRTDDGALFFIPAVVIPFHKSCAYGFSALSAMSTFLTGLLNVTEANSSDVDIGSNKRSKGSK